MEGRVIAVLESKITDGALRAGPRGELYFARAELMAPTLDSGRIVAEEGMLEGARVRVGELVVAATHVVRTQLEVRDGTFVSGRLSESEVFDCEALRLVHAQVDATWLSECDAGIELEGGTMRDSTIHGPLYAIGSAIENTAFYPGASALQLETAMVGRSLFCGTSTLIAHMGSLMCVACDRDIPDVMVDRVSIEAPECPSLDAFALF